jgi:hypothetical protein
MLHIHVYFLLIPTPHKNILFLFFFFYAFMYHNLLTILVKTSKFTLGVGLVEENFTDFTARI